MLPKVHLDAEALKNPETALSIGLRNKVLWLFYKQLFFPNLRLLKLFPIKQF